MPREGAVQRRAGVTPLCVVNLRDSGHDRPVWLTETDRVSVIG